MLAGDLSNRSDGRADAQLTDRVGSLGFSMTSYPFPFH